MQECLSRIADHLGLEDDEPRAGGPEPGDGGPEPKAAEPEPGDSGRDLSDPAFGSATNPSVLARTVSAREVMVGLRGEFGGSRVDLGGRSCAIIGNRVVSRSQSVSFPAAHCDVETGDQGGEGWFGQRKSPLSNLSISRRRSISGAVAEEGRVAVPLRVELAQVISITSLAEGGGCGSGFL